ncbi:MAG: hypothetical protein JOZ29_14890 [Deltaproteobacteria bacterium]|nr:hypothetical protein [Deltaproteobacteria bacterium]
MKRLIVCTLALILAGPVISRAQTDDQDRQNQTQYRDVDDGQALKVVSYILTPVGMALEWGLTRPLHYLATQTSAAPLLSGDKGSPFFTENNNATLVPPGTFRPSTINSSNNLQASNETPAPAAPAGKALAPAQSSPPSKPLLSGSQPALH